MTGRSGKFPVIVPGPSFRVGNQLSQSQGPGWGEKASKVLPGRLPTTCPPSLPSCKQLRLPGVVDGRRAAVQIWYRPPPCPEPAGGRDPWIQQRCGAGGPSHPRPLARIWVKSAAGEN